jgi:cytochrome b
MTTEAARMEAARRGRDTVRVWDPLVRVFHWTVVLGVALNYFVLSPGKAPHRYVGYGVAVALAVRVGWGFFGSAHARFSDFVTPPRIVVSHLASAMTLRGRRYIGHNPAGGAMILALMTLVALTCLTGWMQGLDAFWGVEWVQQMHTLCSNLVVAAVVVHAFAAMAESVLHRENLILAMITGRKRRASGTDIDHADNAGGG